MQIILEPIGIIQTPFTQSKGMPVQPAGAAGIRGNVVLNSDLTNGLLDLDGFSHIYLIYYFHKSEESLRVTPFLDNRVHGVFATRAPKRPNQIGISVVKLLSIKENVLEIENVDIINGTPLLDIKPYVPAFDIYETQKCGWLEHTGENARIIRTDSRFK